MNHFLRLISLCLVFSSTKAQKKEPSPLLSKYLQNPLAVKKMVLQGQQLDFKDLDIDFGAFKNLEELRLDHNLLKQTLYTMGGLISLKILSLSHNQLTKIGVYIKRIRSLQRLDLSYNKMEKVIDYTDRFRNLRNLEVLNLSHNQIKEVDHRIGDIEKLKHLDLSYNKLPRIRRDIGNLEQLEVLNLAGNEICVPSLDASELQALRELDLSNNNSMRVFPYDFLQIETLRTIDVSKCGIEFLVSQKSVYKESFIQKINLADNRIREIPRAFTKLKSLEVLDLRNNDLIEVGLLKHLKGLKKLYLSGNFIPPKEVDKLQKKLPNCKIYHLPQVNDLFTDHSTN